MFSEPRRAQPQRFDTDETRVSIEIEADDESWHSINESTEKPRSRPHSSYVRPPLPDNSGPRRQSRHPNLKGPSPIPGSQLDHHDPLYGDTPWQCGDPYKFEPPKKGDSWYRCFKLTEKYDNELCNAWKEEVDKLLIFAGLFSATVTAFTIESYKWLEEEPDDVSTRLLAFLATQVTNTTLPPGLLPTPFTVTHSQIRINVAWFLSLTLCLTTVLIGILCLQWLREYQRDAALPHKDAVALRQMRYEGLLYWKVPQILAALPVLLQSSLFLFFVGILDLLWTRHTAVAACISSACGLIAIFIAATTAMPALQHAFCSDPHMRVPQCPYKSPQSWIFYRSTHLLFLFLNSLNIQWSISESPRFLRHLKSITDFDWLTFDVRWRQYRDAQEITRATARNLADSKDIIHGVQWINANYSQNVEAVYPIHHSMKDLDTSAATETISGFYQGGQIDNATLRVMLDDRFSPSDYQKRDILSAYYLHLHQDTHPALKMSYIENVIRILNSQDVPQPFYDWLSEILQDLWAASPSSAQPYASDTLWDPELNVQVLLCVKNIISRRHGLKTLDIVVAWALLHRLLAPSFVGLQEDLGIATHLNVGHLRLACGLFEELEVWIRTGKEIERWERTKLCAEGMMTVFNVNGGLLSALNMGWLHGVCPEMAKAQSLVLALSLHMHNLGGVGEVLSRKGWWLEYWDGYSEADWESLAKGFDVGVDEGS